MKVEYNNLYTHIIFITYLRRPLIKTESRERIEKYEFMHFYQKTLKP
jgi:hypothetical protein